MISKSGVRRQLLTKTFRDLRCTECSRHFRFNLFIKSSALSWNFTSDPISGLKLSIDVKGHGYTRNLENNSLSTLSLCAELQSKRSRAPILLSLYFIVPNDVLLKYRYCTHYRYWTITSKVSYRTMCHWLFTLNIYFLINNQPDALIIQIYSVTKLYIFRASSLPIIRSFLLYIRHWDVSCRFLMTASKQSHQKPA